MQKFLLLEFFSLLTTHAQKKNLFSCRAFKKRAIPRSVEYLRNRQFSIHPIHQG